jgi:hypothetical protein
MGHWIASNWIPILASSTATALIGHAVNTFPTPINRYGQWFIGVIQFAIGQRVAAQNTLQGNATVAQAIPAAVAKAATANADAASDLIKRASE